MADYLGNINTLPDITGIYSDRKPSIARTRATDNCFFGFKELPSEKELLEPDFTIKIDALAPSPLRGEGRGEGVNNDSSFWNANRYEHLAEKFGNFLDKVKNGIDAAPQKAGELGNKFVNYKLTTLIQPDTKYPVDVEHLTPKMKIAVLKLYNYAKKEGIEFQIGQASRPEPQQETMKNDPVIGKYAAKCSPHVRNIAIDIHIMGKDLHEAQADLEKLGKYWKKSTHGRWGGDWQGRHHEPWHFDLVPKGQKFCLNNQNKTYDKA